ncbi:MAG: site-specific DNA-methyltransferase, partial [Chloroflexi bacterium]|nr:site-specific DNA-methyltransferase [Chloroflexota bacterium]
MTRAAYRGGEPNFENRTLYHGDNLDFLRGMNSESVHLIATDPPFNKNRDFYATPDSLAAGARFKDRWRWDKDVHEEWTDSLIDDWPAVWEVITAARAAYGDDMGAFLCWLGVRLLEMWRILRRDGSIYLHIDHTAHAYVKCLMDAIFGRKNF